MIAKSGANLLNQKPVCPLVEMRQIVAKRRYICFIITDGVCGNKEYLLTGGWSRGSREGPGASSAPKTQHEGCGREPRHDSEGHPDMESN